MTRMLGCAMVSHGSVDRKWQRGAHLDSIECEFEADLVVALARAAVGDRDTAFTLRDTHLAASDDWTSQRGAEQIAVFEDGVALDRAEAELLNKLLAEVFHDELLRPDLERLGLGRLEVFLLADICAERNHLVSLLNQPG